jgi:hypothetical protein
LGLFGFVLGLFWVCFGFVFAQQEGVLCFHNPLLNKVLGSFGVLGNKLGLFVKKDHRLQTQDSRLKTGGNVERLDDNGCL